MCACELTLCGLWTLLVCTGPLACGGSVDGDTSKGLHRKGGAAKEVYYTLTTPANFTRSVYRFTASNYGGVGGSSFSPYVQLMDENWNRLGAGSARLETTLKANTTYYVLVEERSSADGQGTFKLAASCKAPGTRERGKRACRASVCVRACVRVA